MSEGADSELRQRVLTTLRVYAERGELALAALDAGDLAGFEAAMARRAVAFHNFQALDALAAKAGYAPAADPEARALWERTCLVNSRLADSAGEARLRLGAQLAKNNSASAYARACHSGGVAPAKLIKPV